MLVVRLMSHDVDIEVLVDETCNERQNIGRIMETSLSSQIKSTTHNR